LIPKKYNKARKFLKKLFVPKQLIFLLN